MWLPKTSQFHANNFFLFWMVVVCVVAPLFAFVATICWSHWQTYPYSCNAYNYARERTCYHGWMTGPVWRTSPQCLSRTVTLFKANSGEPQAFSAFHIPAFGFKTRLRAIVQASCLFKSGRVCLRRLASRLEGFQNFRWKALLTCIRTSLQLLMIFHHRWSFFCGIMTSVLSSASFCLEELRHSQGSTKHWRIPLSERFFWTNPLGFIMSWAVRCRSYANRYWNLVLVTIESLRDYIVNFTRASKVFWILLGAVRIMQQLWNGVLVKFFTTH